MDHVYRAIEGDQFAPPSDASGPVETPVRLPEMISFRLPCCAKQSVSARFYAVAADVCRYRCPSCGGDWQVTVTPLGMRGVTFEHRLDWICLRGADRGQRNYTPESMHALGLLETEARS